MVSQQIIEELKVVIQKDYGRDLSVAEVTEIANGLVGYFDTLARIYHRGKIKNEYAEVRNKRGG